jgi:hypothetical protein
MLMFSLEQILYSLLVHVFTAHTHSKKSWGLMMIVAVLAQMSESAGCFLAELRWPLLALLG